MSVGLETHFKRLLREIVTISSGVRDSVLDYADGGNFNVHERLCHQLETIRVSADAVLLAFTRASLTSYSLDSQIVDWFAGGRPFLCLDKLREMNEILKPIDYTSHPTSSIGSAKDKLAVAMAFFDNHKSLFHFLLTPDLWNRERPSHPQSQVNVPPTMDIVATGCTIAPLSDEVEVLETLPDRKKELLHLKLNELSRWLAPMDCMQKHRDALRERQEGTCMWFRNTDVFQRWRKPGCHFLWLHGKAGCGKSVLIASTIEHLKSNLEKEEVVVYFYCDFRNEWSMSSIELMRSLLSQLLRHICDHGVDPGDFPDKVLKQTSEGTLSRDNLEKLCDLVSRAASFFRYEPMIVIDALDECVDIEALLPALVTLSQSDIRLLVTSRPHQIILDHFAGLQSLSFEDATSDVAADIMLHVRRELSLHRRLKSVVSNLGEIVVRLIEKADGRFRWVQCQLDTIKRCATENELQEALASLSNELEAAYERILEAIDERKSEGELARRVLALLVVAMEPLQLAEIVDGLSMDFQEWTHNHKKQEWLENELLQSLSTLVSYDEETGVLTLSHYSVQEYLTSRSALPMYRVIIHEAHAEAAQMCMGYISVFLKQKSSSLGNCELWSCFPMLSYVLSSGFNHLACVDSKSSVTLKALESLESDIRLYPSHWDCICELRERILECPDVPWPSSKHDFVLYILIAYSPPRLLQMFLSSSHWPRIGTNPLIYATHLRKIEHAMILLAHGTDVDARGLVIDDSRCTSPLEAAIDHGDDVLVGELLQREGLVTPELLKTVVLTPRCGMGVLVKLIQTDEFAEWALGIGDEMLYRGVFSSGRPTSGDKMKTDEDHLILVQRLRQVGLNLSVESQFGRDLIKRALHADHTSMLELLLPPDQLLSAEFLIAASTGDTSEMVVRFLLHNGTDVHTASSLGGWGTALHLVATRPSEPQALELTRLLIDAGCDPYALNSDGEAALVVAVRHGHCSVVELLLSCSDIPLPSNILYSAMKKRQNSQMIEFLLSKGADIHVIAQTTGNTLLHQAIIEPGLDWDEQEDDKCRESECISLLKRFLEAGCDPTTRNFSGMTALEIAMERGFTSVVELLLPPDDPLPSNILLTALHCGSTLKMIDHLIQKGAGVHSITSGGDAALHLAAGWKYGEEVCYKLVKRMINAGCDASARNSAGKTILALAIERSFTSVVELLLSSDVSLLLDSLLIAVQQGSTLEMVEHLIYRGADVHSTTSGGDTVLHLALSLHRTEEECCELVRSLINAGCNPSACNSKGNPVILAAIEGGYSSVVELLLSFNVSIPPNILHTALRSRCKPNMIHALVCKLADNDHFLQSISGSDWDALLRLASAGYPGQYCQQVIGILEGVHKACRARPRPEDRETYMPVAKKRRLD